MDPLTREILAYGKTHSHRQTADAFNISLRQVQKVLSPDVRRDNDRKQRAIRKLARQIGREKRIARLTAAQQARRNKRTGTPAPKPIRVIIGGKAL